MIRVGRSIEKIFLSSGFLTFQYDSRNHLLREWWPCGTDTDTRAAAEPTRVDGDGDGDRDRARDATGDARTRRRASVRSLARRSVRGIDSNRRRVGVASRRRRDDPPPS